MNGVGMNGVLSKSAYTTVFEGQPQATEGRVDLTWRLSPPPGISRAGAYQAVVCGGAWKVSVHEPRQRVGFEFSRIFGGNGLPDDTQFRLSHVFTFGAGTPSASRSGHGRAAEIDPCSRRQPR